MKRLLLAAMVLAWATMVHAPARAAVDINIGIALPPPIVMRRGTYLSLFSYFLKLNQLKYPLGWFTCVTA